MKTKILESNANIIIIHNNQTHTNQRGFTLIEILAVVVIIVISVSVVVLSVNSVRQSENEIFLARLENNIHASQTFSKRYNKLTKVEIDTNKKMIHFYWRDADTNTWNVNSKLPAMDFTNVALESTLNNIIIKPNGFINNTTITIKGDERVSSIKI